MATATSERAPVDADECRNNSSPGRVHIVREALDILLALDDTKSVINLLRIADWIAGGAR